MEKRFSPRQEINSSVLVFQNNIGCINALVKNISSHGMLLDTGQCTLPTGAVVELAGPASQQLESIMGLPKAFIVHSDHGKAGLLVVTGNNGGDMAVPHTAAIRDRP
jgi:hypothetical protein